MYIQVIVVGSRRAALSVSQCAFFVVQMHEVCSALLFVYLYFAFVVAIVEPVLLSLFQKRFHRSLALPFIRFHLKNSVIYSFAIQSQQRTIVQLT